MIGFQLLGLILEGIIEDPINLHIDLQKVETISTMTFGSLINVFHKAKKRGRTVTISASGSVKKFLQSGNMDKIINFI